MADALTGALDDAGRIGQLSAVGELDVDVRRVWDQAHREAAHAHATGWTEAEGKDAIGQVDLLLGVRHHLARERAQAAEYVADQGRVWLEEDG